MKAFNKKKSVYLDNPKMIFDRIFDCLDKKKNVDFLLKTRTSTKTIWTKNTFYYDNTKSKFSVEVEEYKNQKVINKFDKLYHCLSNIENKRSSSYANDYLDGYLEEKKINLNEMISHFKSA